MDLEETRAFLAVLDHGSFKAAAEIAKQPRATLRRRVEALEARAGVPLLERSHSGVLATPAGELLARQARAILRETNALLDALREVGSEPVGDLRIGIPADLPPRGAAIVSGLLHTRFPRLRLHVRVCEQPIAELLDHVDIALHVGPPAYTGSESPLGGRWQSHTLLRLHDGLRASRAYLQHHGMPHTLDDLERHTLLGCAGPGELMRWPLLDGGTLELEPNLTSSDAQVVRRFAELGLGIALLSEADAHAFEGDATLVPVLDAIVGRSQELSVVVPEVLAETTKVRAIVSQLAQIVALPNRSHHTDAPVSRAMM